MLSFDDYQENCVRTQFSL